ncbi:hypothetical protein MGYG_09113 [Nannizzia gypsea CBS 118893]|uniref:Uncharacterized protein n=1 Tax=Arthroderma gypseum (strain ATCC MYA-4604 / CBS 118893) TaxID=535722 RepID=E4V0G8_ARTGP|nr:hypothetical protein MGYG_09113 [Nannizzia gypsea CBS 118893]EFR03105.1 hypothetical protein MGYG_09113 [Nannizzia gypsea CBS 118893]
MSTSISSIEHLTIPSSFGGRARSACTGGGHVRSCGVWKEIKAASQELLVSLWHSWTPRRRREIAGERAGDSIYGVLHVLRHPWKRRRPRNQRLSRPGSIATQARSAYNNTTMESPSIIAIVRMTFPSMREQSKVEQVKARQQLPLTHFGAGILVQVHIQVHVQVHALAISVARSRI